MARIDDDGHCRGWGKMHTCETCEQSFMYDPKYHECRSERDKQEQARLLAGRGESWIDECMRKQVPIRES